MSLVECPSGFAFVARRFTGRTLAQLAAKADLGDLGSFVAQCCVTVEDPGPYAVGKDGQPNWKLVIAGDLAVAFTRLRAISIPSSHDGESFKWKLRCAQADCRDEMGKRTEYFWHVQLCDLPVVKLTDEARAIVKAGNRFPGKLLDGRAFTFKLPTDEDGAVVRKLLRDSGINLREIPEGSLGEVVKPFLVAARVLSVEGAHADCTRDEVVDLDPWSIADITKQIDGADCGFDSFKGKCPACGDEPDLSVPTTPQLLFSLESAERKTTKKEPLPPPSSSVELGASSTPASPG